MPRVKDPSMPYAGRRLDATVINTTLDADAVDLLHRFCPKGRKSTGKFLSRLLYEHAIRVEQKQKLERALHEAYGEEVSVS